jgi:hypothetical protein
MCFVNFVKYLKLLIAAGVAVVTFQSNVYAQTSGIFKVEDDQVWYIGGFPRKQLVDQAQAASFSQLFGSLYAKDKNRVYFLQKPLVGAEPDTFQALAPRVGRDAQRVYFADQPCLACDSASFKKLSNLMPEIYVDKNAVYDGNGKPVPEADAATFEVLPGGWYSKDKNAAYFGLVKLDGVDVASFSGLTCKAQVLGIFTQDKNRCYFSGQPVPCNCTVPETRFDKATQVLSNTGLLRFQVPFNDLYSVKNTANAKEVFDTISHGYWRVKAGRQSIALSCLKRSGPAGAMLYSVEEIEIKAGSFQVVREQGKGDCEVEIARPAMILGQYDWPNVQLQFEGDPWPQFQRELPAGLYSFTAICTFVTRTESLQAKVKMQQRVEPGIIYNLRAKFDPATSNCDVSLVP